MTTLNCIETYIDENRNHYGCFLIEPLEIGQGVTLGNALRRTILSELSGYAISGVRINNLKHEFALIEGLREDVLEVLLNLKEVIFKRSYFSRQEDEFNTVKGFLNVKGPVVVTSGMFRIPKNYLTILNPNLYICTIVDNSELYLEIDIEKGKGYKLSEEIRNDQIKKSIVLSKHPSTLFVDSIFLPIKKVNFKVKLIYDTKGNIKESLTLELLTNGSITPIRAIEESCKNLLELVSSLFINSNFSEILKNSTKISLKKE
jgi:DNA-directed RNA polymerase subunit alpha